jgi:hypothetical protein
MRKTGTFAGLAAALAVGLGSTALVAVAAPVAHSSGCVPGKEASGCKLNGTGYYDASSRVIVGFPTASGPKGAPTQLSVPSAFVCAGGGEANLTVETKAVARIGGSLSFSGKAKVQGSSEGIATIKSATVTAKLKITNAKKATLSGEAEIVLKEGTKCMKKLPAKLVRVLGG